MTQEPERVKCPNCGADNYPDIETCWQCSQPLRAGEERPAEQAPPPAEGEYQPPPGYTPEPPGSTPPPPGRRDTDTLVTWGFVLGGLAFLCCCCPPVFAIPAIILGAIAYSRGDQRGLWVIIVGVVALLMGTAAGVWWAPRQRWVPGLQDGMPGPWHRT